MLQRIGVVEVTLIMLIVQINKVVVVVAKYSLGNSTK